MTRPQPLTPNPQPPGVRGQALVELAVTLPVLLFFGLACLQVALLLLAQLSVMTATRDGARWLAAHPHTTDAAATAAIRARLPANLNSSSLSIGLSPPCAHLADGKCDGRKIGDRLTVTLAYNWSSHLFVPNNFGCCGFVAQLPTSAAPYAVHMVIEPEPR